MKPLFFLLQFLMALRMIGIGNDTLHRANLYALRGLMEANALRAMLVVDLVVLIAFADGLIWTLRFTGATIDAFLSNG